jgi:hypothetical protein
LVEPIKEIYFPLYELYEKYYENEFIRNIIGLAMLPLAGIVFMIYGIGNLWNCWDNPY